MAYNTIADLDSLISTLNTLSNNARQSENQRYRRDASMYDDYSKQIDDAWSNDKLDIVEKDMNNYMNKFGNSMNELSIENFTIARDKLNRRRESNMQFKQEFAGLEDAKEEMNTGIGTYMQIQDSELESLNYTPNKNSKYYSEDIKEIEVKNPGNISNFVGTNEEYYNQLEQWEEAKKHNQTSMVNNMKLQQENYIKSVIDMRRNHADRLGTEGYAIESQLITNWNELFSFGIESLKDDFYMDDKEYEAYNDAMRSGSFQSVAKYIENETSHNKNVSSSLKTQANDIYETVNENHDTIGKYQEFTRLYNTDRDSAEKLAEQEFMTVGNEIITYGDLIKSPGVLDTSYETMINKLAQENIGEASKVRELQSKYYNLIGQNIYDDLEFDSYEYQVAAGQLDKKVGDTQTSLRDKAIATGSDTYEYDGKKYTIDKEFADPSKDVLYEEPKPVTPREELPVIRKGTLDAIGIGGYEQDFVALDKNAIFNDFESRGIKLKLWQEESIKQESIKTNNIIIKVNNELSSTYKGSRGGIFWDRGVSIGDALKMYEEDMKNYELIKQNLADAKEVLTSGPVRIDHPEIDRLQLEMNKIENKYTVPEKREFFIIRKKINKKIEDYNSSIAKIKRIK